MPVNRIQGGSGKNSTDLNYWTKYCQTVWTKHNTNNGYWTNIASGDWISQVVDFTDAPTLTYDLYSTFQVNTTCQTYIDEVLVGTHSIQSGQSTKPITIDVSSYSGQHTLKFVLTGGANLSIGNIVLFAYTSPIPNFSFTFPNSPTNPKVVNFADSTTADPASWLWDFGDGTTSTSQSPSHTYTENKSYQVKLTATNIKGSTEITKTVTLPTPPGTDFKASGVNGLTVKFEDLTTNTPTGWTWDFGENEKVVQNPQHTYQNPGTYTVKLTAVNTHGSIQASKSVQVTVTTPVKPTANFSSAVPNAGSPLGLQFTDQSSGSPTSWAWDFGDGGISTLQSPSHTYTKAGLYTVNLIATNQNGSSTVSKSINVQSGTVTPPASGAASPGTVQVGQTVRVTLTGTGFKLGSKVRIIKPTFWGTVSKIISLSSTQIVFDFCFSSEYLGSCGIAVITTTGKTILFENAITVS